MTRPPPPLTLPERRVVGHQLALGAVAGEADDDHPARLDRGDDALAEAGVDDVVAGAEAPRGPGSIGRARAAPSAAASQPPAPPVEPPWRSVSSSGSSSRKREGRLRSARRRGAARAPRSCRGAAWRG